jgi:membrane-bound lytic murein transglycosylase D
MLRRYALILCFLCLPVFAGFFDWFSSSEDKSPSATESTVQDDKKTATDEVTEQLKEEENFVFEMNTGVRPWRAPQYQNQEGALGYNSKVFEVPEGLRPKVNFWKDVYAKYTTHQGVIHDAENVHIVFESVDFKAINKDETLNSRQKFKAREKLVKEAKKRAQALLLKLDETKDPATLTPEEKKFYDAYAFDSDKDKFKEAASDKRIRFQLGQKDRFAAGIYMSGRYLEQMEKIFQERGLPIELTRLPFVESSFNIMARSKVGASGIWQIMRYTGRPFLKMDQIVDKRNHPIEATKLATRLLAHNFEMLESWPLAITGYNHGPTGVLKLVNTYKTRDIVELVDSNVTRKRFGFASRNFYACFLAALEVERNAPVHFGEKVAWSLPLKGKEVSLPVSVSYNDLVKWFDGNDDQAQIYNPHITGMARKKGRLIQKGTLVNLPEEKADKVLTQLSQGNGSKGKADAFAQSL